MGLSPKGKAWFDACVILVKDPDAVVRCPNCNQANLDVMDVFPKSCSPGGERYVSCPACKRYDAALFRYRPQKMAATVIEE